MEHDRLQAAGRLLHEAMARCERLNITRGSIAEEDKATSELRAQNKALRREIEQYQGWMASSDSDGEAFRLNKALCEEVDRRGVLEDEVHRLRDRLAAISGSLRSLTQQHAAQAASEAAINSNAVAALGQLDHLRNLRAGHLS